MSAKKKKTGKFIPTPHCDIALLDCIYSNQFVKFNPTVNEQANMQKNPEIKWLPICEMGNDDTKVPWIIDTQQLYHLSFFCIQALAHK